MAGAAAAAESFGADGGEDRRTRRTCWGQAIASPRSSLKNCRGDNCGRWTLGVVLIPAGAILQERVPRRANQRHFLRSRDGLLLVGCAWYEKKGTHFRWLLVYATVWCPLALNSHWQKSWGLFARKRLALSLELVGREGLTCHERKLRCHVKKQNDQSIPKWISHLRRGTPFRTHHRDVTKWQIT